MSKKKTSNLRLGIFVTTSILLFIIAVYLVGSRKSMFQPTIKVTTLFDDVKGLRDGGNVRFTGINVGTVTRMTILNDSTVEVEMALEKKVTPFIKKNSHATIASEGLMGNKIVVVLPGSEDAQPIDANDVLPSIEPIEIDDILREIMTSGQRISVVSSNLIEITDKINRGEGIFGKIFTDTTMTYNLERSSRNLKEISDRVTRGEGLIGRLLVDTTFAGTLDSSALYIEAISYNLEGITDKINRGEGLFGKFFTDSTMSNNLQAATRDLGSSSKNLEQLSGDLLEITDKINNGRGVINKFLVDSVFADSLDITLRQLNETIIQVEEASRALQRSGLVRAFSKKEEGPAKKEE